jgi:hypothetical protein
MNPGNSMKRILVTGADRIALSLHHSFCAPVSVIFPFNTHGPRQSARMDETAGALVFSALDTSSCVKRRNIVVDGGSTAW